MKTLKDINEFIKANKGGVNPAFRQKYHMMPPVGWMNDPNGLCVFNGKYHLFYQFNPYDSKPGTMLWGHFTSDDLIKYEDEDVALVPEEKHVGIFSGGALQTDGRLCAVFTQHYEYGLVKREGTYRAYSSDGVTFGQRKKIFDNDCLPANLSRTDFRDPYPIIRDGEFYVFLGGKDKREDRGVIVVLKGKSIDELKYAFTIGPFYELGDMGECPSLCRMGDKDVFVVSGCNVKQRGNDFKNVNSSVFIVGEINFSRGVMDVDFIKEIDKGDCFYAPQFINGADVPTMTGWHEMWGKRYPTQENGDGWAGAFTIPREITVKDGDIFQTPVSTLDKYCKPYVGGGAPRCARIKIRFIDDGKAVFIGEDGEFSIYRKDGYISLDTLKANNFNGCVRSTDGKYADCELTVLLDVSGIEVFVDGGREAISSRIYVKGEFSLKTDGGADVVSVEKVEI